MKKLLLASAIILSTFTSKAQTWDSTINGITRLSTSGLLPTCTEVLHLSGNTILGSTTSGIYKSTNYGDKWTLKTTNFQGYNGVRKTSTGRILGLGLPIMTGMFSVAKSDDNGDTWNNTSGLPSNLIVEDMVQTPNNKIYIACRTTASVYVSSDNGDTWTSVSKGIPTTSGAALWSIEAVDNDTLVAGASDGIYRTIDAGANWTKAASTGTGYVTALKKHKNGTIYCGLASGFVKKSDDNGKTWTNTSMTGSSAMVYDIEMDKSDNIYISIFNSGIAKYNSAEAPLGAVASATMGMTYPRVQDFMIDESGSTPIYMAATMNSATISGYFYRAGYTSTSIKEIETQNFFSVFPNPAQNTINITGLVADKKSNISIYSIDGKVQYSKAFMNNQIEVSYLPIGNYFLAITNENGQSSVQQFEKK
jgi:photosystem II stability/assembly factor-like uncharacterized protein